MLFLFLPPSLASVNMYNATSSITFSYFSGRLVVPRSSQGRPEKYGHVSQSNSSEGILAQFSSNQGCPLVRGSLIQTTRLPR